MEKLRASHHTYIKQYMEKQLAGNKLRGKLVAKQSLDRADATGDSFCKMLGDIAKVSAIASPYRLKEN